MRKRSLPMYLFLNCLTLGIYGFITGIQMNSEVNALCKGDKQEPGVPYGIAVLLRLVPFFGPIYFNYFSYQQANRIKLNANRYGLTVKESGTDSFLMRTALQLPLIFVTAVEIALAALLPTLIVWLISLSNPGFALVMAWLFGVVLVFFAGELSGGANFSNYYLMKNLNRFADVYRNGAAPFDPMAYDYYPAAAAKYPNFVPGMINGTSAMKLEEKKTDVEVDTSYLAEPPHTGGCLKCVKGSLAGYDFKLESGEEIVIGKDAKVAQVVIDPSFKEISRKHVSIRYDARLDQYRVVDYSSNGTWANGSRLTLGQETFLPHKSELKLANEKNRFILD